MTILPVITDPEIADLSFEGEPGFGALETARGCLPLKAMDVQTRISGLVAHITMRQTYSNALDEALEATYIFPLPARGAVTHFQMAVNGRIVDGVLKERGEARQEYQQAIEAGHRAAITEEERPSVFTLRVGNLMPGEDAEIRLTVTAPLPFSDGEATFRFPLVVAPRYIPGAPLPGSSVGDGVAVDTDAVPDASRISPVLLPGFPNPVALSLAVELDTAGLGALGVRSSLHAVVEDEAGERWRRIAVKPDERLDRDFILRFQVADDSVRTALLLQRDAEGDGGTFQLTLTPPVSETRAARPRDVVFVLDRSGSMRGWKMVAARRALGRMVDTLTEQDRFDILAFDNVIERPGTFEGQEAVAATDRNRFRAIEFLAKLDARGGTEMAGPLNQAADELAGGYADRDAILVLVTDGQVGNEAQILRSIQKRLRRSRIFTLGIDRAINAGFLKRLAALGGGACELVESEDRLDEVMGRIHRRVDRPVLTEVLLEAEGLEIVKDSQVPGRLPDLFAGTPLTVYGRFGGRPSGRIRVRATDAAGGKWSQTVVATAAELEAIGALWARGQLRQLEDRYSIGAGDPELAERIVQISLKHGVLCRFTAFVAVDRSEVVNEGGGSHYITQPVEAPSGWEMAVLGAQIPAPTGYGGAAKTMAVDASALGLQGGGGDSLRYMARAQAPERRMRKRSVGGAVANFAKTLAGLGRQVKGVPYLESSEAELVQEAASQDDAALDGYRRRAKRLLELLERSARGNLAQRRRALGRLAIELRALLEDAASVGIDASLLTELKPLVEALKPAVSAPESLDEAAIDALFEQSKTELEGFAEGGTPSRRKDDFWK